MLVENSEGRNIHRTDIGDKWALWEVGEDGIPRILSVNDNITDRPALRWPHTPLPECRPGYIEFGPGNYPTLAVAIDLLPEYEECLWEAVRMEHRTASGQ